MALICGIVGLPNVGKSTLFNALTETAQAAVANYPFCTIEPNVGRVPVPDDRTDRLARVSKSPKVTPTFLEFVDIAGLVRGASTGEGLGNKFLSHIREVDAIVHVLRCFEDPDVSHVEGEVDPVRDAEIVDTELMLADLAGLERRVEILEKRATGGDKEARQLLPLMRRVLAVLREGRPARSVALAENEQPQLKQMQLLTAKPVLYVSNVTEADAASGNRWSEAVAAHAAREHAGHVVVCAAIEAELAAIADPQERSEYLASLGLEESGLARVVREGYRLLGLITFFTTGPKETRAWTVPTGCKAAQAAGQIHTDFERGFIRAETIDIETLIAAGGEQAAREAGKMRSEGRDYVVRDGDVILFRFNV
jgi:GTP-binding protein YchF